MDDLNISAYYDDEGVDELTRIAEECDRELQKMAVDLPVDLCSDLSELIGDDLDDLDAFDPYHDPVL